MSKETMKKIAITGVMGVGKSSAIKIIQEAGYHVLDCDRINDELLLPKHKGYEALVNTFGETILAADSTLNRQAMSNEIFHDQTKKKQAEAILHPLIKQEINERINQLQREQIVFVEVPLLYEVGWDSSFDEVWVIASKESLIYERLKKYRRIEEKEVKQRLAAQISQEIKIQKADHVIWNNSDKESLKQQIYDILEIENKRK